MSFFYDHEDVPIWFQILVFAIASAVAPFVLAAIVSIPWAKVVPYLIGSLIGTVIFALYLKFRD